MICVKTRISVRSTIIIRVISGTVAITRIDQDFIRVMIGFVEANVPGFSPKIRA